MDRPIVSLLMPAYNAVQFIKAAIDSLKAQTYKGWELIIVDDGSTDGTWELASKLAESDFRIKVYRNETNLGIPKNRAKCFSYSTGNFIGHFDNDDVLERYALEEMLLFLLKNPTCMLAYSDMAQIGIKNELHHYLMAPDLIPTQLHKNGWRHLGIYRREVMNSIDGYNTQLISGCEDGDIFMQIAEKFVCTRVPKILYYHRATGVNASDRNKKCESCSERPVCNYARVWAKHAGYDLLTFTPLKEVQNG